MTTIHKTPQIQMHKQRSEGSSDSVQMQNRKVDYDKYKHVPKQVMEVAEAYESQFTNFLLNEMKKSSSLDMGPAEKIYNSMLDEERSQMMAKTNTGLGIKDVVIRDLMQKMGHNNFNQPGKQQVEMYKKVNSQKGESI